MVAVIIVILPTQRARINSDHENQSDSWNFENKKAQRSETVGLVLLVVDYLLATT
jgi:hypothetical protein